MEHLKWRRLALFSLLLLGLFLFFYFEFHKYLTFQYIKTNRELLLNYVNEHQLLAPAIFLAIYITATAISAPGALFLSLICGFLFGTILGTILIVFGATLGATIIFYATKTTFYDFFYHKAGFWYKKMADGFTENSINYLLFLRLVPLFPFWVINIVPALFGVSTKTFIWTTFIGIIPGTITYVALGSGMGIIFDQNQTPNLNIILKPQILLPIIALATLSLVPIAYKLIKTRLKNRG